MTKLKFFINDNLVHNPPFALLFQKWVECLEGYLFMCLSDLGPTALLPIAGTFAFIGNDGAAACTATRALEDSEAIGQLGRVCVQLAD